MQLLMFYAPWCTVCKGMDAIVEKLVEKYPEVKLSRLNVEEANSYDERIKWGVRTIPTFVFLENDAMIDRVEGAFSYDQGVNWFEDNLGITLEKERKGELPLVK